MLRTKEKRKTPIQIPQVLNQGILQHGRMYLAYEIQRRYGCRFSEVITIGRHSIVDAQTMRIKATKNSYDLYVYAPDIIAYILDHAHPDAHFPFFNFTYRSYWRFLHKLNAFERIPGRKNNRVSQLPRAENFRRKVTHAGGKTSSISRSQGHRSNRSIDYYLLTPNTQTIGK